jgi:hypothetical protein
MGLPLPESKPGEPRGVADHSPAVFPYDDATLLQLEEHTGDELAP